MRRTDTIAIAVLLMAVLLSAACGSARRGAPLEEPVALDAEAARGEAVFMRYCNGCHPGGEGGLGPGLNNKPLPGFAIRFQVRNGLGVMPAFPDEVLPDEDLDALVDYLRTLR